MATTGTNLFQEVNKLPEKVQVNVERNRFAEISLVKGV